MFILEQIKNYYANQSPICRIIPIVMQDIGQVIRECIIGIDVSDKKRVIINKCKSRFHKKSLDLGDNYGSIEIQLYNREKRTWSGIDWVPFETYGEHNCFRVITRKSKVEDEIQELAYFELIRMYNFCAELVLTNLKGREEYIPLVHKTAYDIAQLWGYTKLLTTDYRKDHKWYLTIGGWKEISSFKNRRSGNVVYMCEKHVKPL